jgi:hypothetical protein
LSVRCWIVVAVLLLAPAAPMRAEKFDTRTADFAVSYNGETSAYRDTSAFVLPRAAIAIQAVGGPPGDYVLTAKDGTAIQHGARKWHYTAPNRPGLYKLSLDGPAKKDGITLHVFVTVPASEVRNGLLNGYRIGQYPSTPLKGNPLYKPPRGFVEVTKDNQDTKVSPHFTLKQFLCKEDSTKTFPKYVVLEERLPLKLEAILERVNQLGFKTDTLHVMSAYRTPYYNHAIGDVKYSMHQWGSAADIYVDPDEKDRMEDLNRDGRVDTRDSKWLYDVIEKMMTEQDYRKFEGGLGFYPATSAHPPFVHIDVRGAKARWQG